MNFLLGPVLSYLLVYKYLALFGITFLASLGLPIPSDPALLAASAFASQGYFTMWIVLLVATLGNIGGDIAAYWLARKFGKPILYALGFRKVIESETFKWVETEVSEHRAAVVVLSRFNEITTISVNIIAGLSTMPFVSFLLYDVYGEIAQVLVFAGIGYFFGSNWQDIYNVFGKLSIAFVLLLVLFLIFASRRLQKHLMATHKHKKPIAPDGEAG